MSPRPLPQVGRYPPRNHITLQWHPTMAPSNGTTSFAPCNGTLVPRPIRQSGSSPSPPLEVRTPIAIAIWGNMNSRDEKLKRKEVVVESKKVRRDQEWFNMIQYDSISIKIFTTTKQLHCTSKPSTRQPCTVWRPMRFAFETWTTLLWFHIFRRTPRRCWCHAKPGMSRSPRPRVQGQLSRRHCQPHAWQEACEKSHNKCYQIW